MLSPVTLPAVPPVAAGDVVHVPEHVELPSGRIVRPGHYTVVRVDGRRICVGYRPDCRQLGPGFSPKQVEGGRWFVPPCAEPAKAWLDSGDWKAYADGVGPVVIPDRPQRDSVGPGSFSS